ncbi:bifunctional transcriptional activator/DNA repair enzyme AdaA [Paenibacillus chitinolyticus]|uniref:bifunctional transcriptional activator/DNA repair enzyme AdaA n=1 Tax=Paenibacillus chitinolyticus TaxID=79263 RepID=UPI00366D3276
MNKDAIFKSVYETILSRDTRHDGQYYVGITSTGIFCRPSCRSRTPKPENVRVYDSIERALDAGFRPCKRCKPENPSPHGPDAELAETVLGLIRTRYGENLTLHGLASELNISPYHLQRTFKRTTGISPSRQLLLTRMEEAKHRLARSEQPIGEIAAAVGFRSASHFSAVFHKTAGCTPNEFREQNAPNS